MRQIKFRGLTSKRVWVFGSYIQTNVDAPAIVFGDGEQAEIIPDTLGQFTGLKDVNGTEIYEGDVIKHLLSRKEGEVSYFEGAYVFHKSITQNALVNYNSVKFLEVISNIHDEFDLLNVRDGE